MVRKLIAMTLALHLSLPVSLLAQETEHKPKNETEEIQLLLSNIKKDNDAVKYLIGGAAGLTAAASAGYAAYIHKRLTRLARKFAAAEVNNTAAFSEMQKTLLSTVEELSTRLNLGDEAAEVFRNEMVNVINGHAAVINKNSAALQQLVSESVARKTRTPIGFTATQQRDLAAKKAKPNKAAEGAALSLIEEITPAKTVSPKLNSHLKNMRNIKKNSKGGGIVAGLVFIGITVAAAAILNTEENNYLISSRRAEFEKILHDTHKDYPESLVFTAQRLAEYNPRLTASVLAQNPEIKALFKEQAADLMSKETKTLSEKYALILAEQQDSPSDKIYDIKNGLLNFDYYKSKYDFKNPIPVS